MPPMSSAQFSRGLSVHFPDLLSNRIVVMCLVQLLGRALDFATVQKYYIND